MTNRSFKAFLAAMGPGILVAATGVGAGDLATGALVGTKIGVAVLWAVLLGAAMKYVVNEGLARWQLATGETLLEGAVSRLGRPIRFLFVPYLLFWSYFVALALMSACGISAFAIWDALRPAEMAETLQPMDGKIVFGIMHSIVAVVVVRIGGFRLFEKVMNVCIAVMFVTVVTTAIAVRPDWSAVAAGLVFPIIPDLADTGLSWTIALIGGVGGTVTVLCYGYWIREEGRDSTDDIPACRLDLATAYGMTALFGIAMVILGSQIEVEGKGATLLVQIADQLEQALGGLAKWAFLIGGWGAIFSSLLGVWQSVPYLFVDLWTMPADRAEQQNRAPVNAASRGYKSFLYGLAVVPMSGLFVSFDQAQKAYAIVGAAFVPMLAVVLLLLNGRADWVGERFQNSRRTTIVLWAILLFFVVALGFVIHKSFFAA